MRAALLTGVILAAGAGLAAQSPAADACAAFAARLAEVPATAFSTGAAAFTSPWDGAVHDGCEVVLETTDAALAGTSVPPLTALPGDALYAAGWRADPAVAADGPGTSAWGLRLGAARCVVRREQPASLSGDGRLTQAGTLSLRVQCLDEPAGVTPEG